jgi:hypothetical protein
VKFDRYMHAVRIGDRRPSRVSDAASFSYELLLIWIHIGWLAI